MKIFESDMVEVILQICDWQQQVAICVLSSEEQSARPNSHHPPLSVFRRQEAQNLWVWWALDTLWTSSSCLGRDEG